MTCMSYDVSYGLDFTWLRLLKHVWVDKLGLGGSSWIWNYDLDVFMIDERYFKNEQAGGCLGGKSPSPSKMLQNIWQSQEPVCLTQLFISFHVFNHGIICYRPDVKFILHMGIHSHPQKMTVHIPCTSSPHEESQLRWPTAPGSTSSWHAPRPGRWRRRWRSAPAAPDLGGSVSSWRGTPSHPFPDGIFQDINHPAIKGYHLFIGIIVDFYLLYPIINGDSYPIISYYFWKPIQ